MIKIQEPGAIGLTYIFLEDEGVIELIGWGGYHEAYEIYRILGNGTLYLAKRRRGTENRILEYNQVPFFLNRRMKRVQS